MLQGMVFINRIQILLQRRKLDREAQSVILGKIKVETTEVR